MKTLEYDVVIVGGGAGGLLASIRASELGAKTIVLEKMSKPARKILITGKGRCNITTADDKDVFIQNVNPDGNFLRNAFHQFYSDDILRMLEEQGVHSLLERGSRYFPASNKSADVVDALVNIAKHNGVKILCNSKVEDILVQDNVVKVIKTEKNIFHAKNVIIATGGKTYQQTGSTGDGYFFAKQLGHTINDTFPSLIPLETKQKLPDKCDKLLLKNVNAELYIDNKKVAEEFGELQLMKYGLTGAIILTLSRQVAKALQSKQKVYVNIDLKPALNIDKLDKRLLRELNEKGNKSLREMLKTILPMAILQFFSERINLSLDKQCSQINSNDRKNILQNLKKLKFEIIKTRPFNEAIITSGGVDVKEVNPKTMESKIIKNLYFAGEILDLDAPTGGYNLQIAFTTGWVAGNSVNLPIV